MDAGDEIRDAGPTEDADAAYDLKPIAAPRLAGTALRAFTGLLESRAGGSLLSRSLLKRAGVADLRRAAVDAPHPLRPPLPGPVHPEPAPPVPAAALAALPTQQPAPQAGFAFETAADFTTAYHEQGTDPLAVAERLLAACQRSEAHEPPLRILISQDPADLLEQARASSERWAAGRPLGPLDGVPLAVKDELDQLGYPTTVGTAFLGRQNAAEDAWAVARLRAAGALLLGKANMHEIGLGVTGVNPHHGAARNPYDPSRVTGGSSSGPAAACASGLCPIALGADGGGSIRNPAALCGLIGLKPTFGRVSERGAAPLCWSVAHVGPLAVSARDATLAYGVIAGTDPGDPNSLGQPPPALDGFGRANLNGVRLGIYAPWFEDAEPAVVAACRQTLAVLERAGAEVVAVTVPELALLRVVHMVTIVSEMAAAHAQHVAADRGRYGHDTRINLQLAARLSAVDYIQAQRLRVHLSGHFYRLLESVDAIVTPTTACTAPAVPADALATGESNLAGLERIMRFAPAANLTGLPAISFPAGYDQAGLPVGLQALGRPWEEDTLLGLAAVAERSLARRRPRVHQRLLARD